MEKIIEINGISKDYGKGKGIFNFSYEIYQGEVFGFVGSNGSGKTTTIRHMMGFLKPQHGRIAIAGLDSWKDAKELKKLIGYIPGQIDFPDVGTGADFLKIQADYLDMTDLTYMNELIDRFKLDIGASLKRMSKGMKQKTAIVAAFMNQPDILILDEPSTGLDPMMRDELIDLINEQKVLGKTIFISSHVFLELEATCDRVAFIHDGQMINVVSRDEIRDDLESQYQIGFQDQSQYKIYASQYPEKIAKKNDNYRHLIVKVADCELNRFFKSLHGIKIRYLKNIPYSLEWYYTNIILEKELSTNV